MSKLSTLLSLILISLSLIPVSASLGSYSNYLAKMIPAHSRVDANFKELNYDESINRWLENVDAVLETNRLVNLDADFELVLAPDSSIQSLRLIELREENLEKFKDFVANFLDIKLPALPESIPANTKFTLNAKWKYIDRNDSGLNLNSNDALTAFAVYDEEQNIAFAKKLDEQDELNAVLIEPDFLDFPTVGERLRFELPDLKAKAQARVVGANNKELKVLISKFLLEDGTLLSHDRTYTLKQHNPDKAYNYAEAMVNNAAYMMNIVGIGPAISTDGIAAGAAIGLGFATGAMKEYSKVYSFNISQGDSFTLEGGLKNL